MDPVSLALAIVATIDLCLKYGEKLVEACQTYKNAESVAQERALRVEVCWKRTRDQIEYIREAHQDFDQELNDLQARMFDLLESKLKAITRKFDELHKEQLKLKKWRLVTAKECLDKAITELEEWQALFDPSWTVILRMARRTLENDDDRHSMSMTVRRQNTTIANDMRHAFSGTNTSAFFQKDPLALATRSHILNSTVQLAHVPKDGKQYIVEELVCNVDADANILAKDVREIVSKLRTVDPVRFGILQCKGAIRKTQGTTVTAFELVFRRPEGFSGTPRSFRTLISTSSDHSLTERLLIAQQLARAICYVHTLDFVHKNVRPESILTFEQSGTRLGSTFLVGFQRFRAADGRTQLRERSGWDIDLYRHPERQGEHPEGAYIMQHDMYSLGVCLLEIGLWSSFVVFTTDDSLPVPGPALGVSEDFFYSPKAVKEKLVIMAKEVLPSRMGDKFAGVVTNCLTCLDLDNPYFSDQSEFQDADGVLIGVKYIEKILLELEGISL